MKLHYIALSLLICSYIHTMQTKSLKEQRRAAIQEIDSINAQLRAGKCTSDIFTRKKQLTQLVIASYKREITGTNKKYDNKIRQYINRWEIILAELEHPHDKDPDLSQSVAALQYGMNYTDKHRQRVIAKLRELNNVKQKLRRAFNKKQNKEQPDQENNQESLNHAPKPSSLETEDKEKIEQIVLGTSTEQNKEKNNNENNKPKIKEHASETVLKNTNDNEKETQVNEINWLSKIFGFLKFW